MFWLRELPPWAEPLPASQSCWTARIGGGGEGDPRAGRLLQTSLTEAERFMTPPLAHPGPQPALLQPSCSRGGLGDGPPLHRLHMAGLPGENCQPTISVSEHA